jgi:hypothetical protein
MVFIAGSVAAMVVGKGTMVVGKGSCNTLAS